MTARKRIEVAERMYNLLFDIWDNGDKSESVKKYNLSLNDIRTIENIYHRCRSGKGAYTLSEKIKSMYDDFGFNVTVNGIGWLISLD